MNTEPFSFDSEDPRLTAYALGEMPDPAERAAVEHLLEQSPEARAALHEIREITAALTAEYEHERGAATPGNVVAMPPRTRAWPRRLLLAAAMLLLMASVARLTIPHRSTLAVVKPSKPERVTRDEPLVALDSSAAMQLPKDMAASPSITPAAGLREPEEIPFPLPIQESGRQVAIETFPVPPADQPAAGAVTLAPPAATAPPMGSLLADASTAPAMPMIPPPGQAIAQAAAPAPARAKSAPNPHNDITLDQNRAGAYGFAESSTAKPSSASGSVTRDLSLETRGIAVTRSRQLAAQPSMAMDAVGGVAEVDMLKKAEKDKAYPDGSDAKAYEPNTALYEHRAENPFLAAKDNPLSTFSIDVDTASYANVRRFIESGNLPPPDAVRIEEMINYFPYSYAPPAPGDERPFAVHLEAASCPWNPQARLVRIGIKGRELARDKRPASNLVFLLDVSGSMEPSERLPLIKASMRLLVEQLTAEDRVAIVTYAGESGVALPSTAGDKKETILRALDNLQAGGSTNGASGIKLAYRVAREGFIQGGTNRVILATDGDFNVGVTSQGDLVRLIEHEAKGGVALSALGVGTDNYKDATMQKLADKGNGNYHYIDRLDEARKVLVEQMSGTLVTIAKDVKIQVEFNPAAVSAYRLIGYEKRMLRKEDFNDDRVDAGEIGAGHCVTALYEVVPVGLPVPQTPPAVEALKYGNAPASAAAAPIATVAAASGELLTVKMRHKAPDGDKSERSYEEALTDHGTPGDFDRASADFKFAAAVASFGMALQGSAHQNGATLGAALELAQQSATPDPGEYRAGFIELVKKARAIQRERGE